MPRLILQPDGSALCGQCCIAMAAGVSLRTVVNVCGESPEGMGTDEVRRGLLHFGIPTARRMHPVKDRGLGRMNTGRAILHTKQSGAKCGHWSLLWDGAILDPGGPYTALYFPTQIVSYLRIFKMLPTHP